MAVSKAKLVVVLAGVAVVSGIAVALLRVEALSPGYVTLHTYTDDASGLMDGTPVRLDGIRVGFLEAQDLTNSRNLLRKVKLTFKVRNEYLVKIPADSVVGLASDNLLGDQYLAIHRGRAAEPIAAGSEVAAFQGQDISKIMAGMGRQFDAFQAIAARADKLLTTVNAGGGGALGKLAQDPTLKQSAGAKSELDQLMDEVQHGHGTLAKLMHEDPLQAQLEAPLKRVDAVMADANATTAKLKEFTERMDAVSAEVRTLQDMVKAGKGTIGGLNELQQRFDELSVKVAAMQERLSGGQGTLGQVMVNPALNDAIAGTTREFQELAKGIRANPRKFIAIRLF